MTGGTSASTGAITITGSGVAPKTLTVGYGARVTITNNDSAPHEFASNPHPVHTDCPEINGPVLQTGMSFTATGGGAQASFATAPRGSIGLTASRFEVYYLEQPRGGAFEVQVDGKPAASVDTTGDGIRPNWSGSGITESSVIDIGAGGKLGSLPHASGAGANINLNHANNAVSTSTLTIGGGGALEVFNVYSFNAAPMSVIMDARTGKIDKRIAGVSGSDFGPSLFQVRARPGVDAFWTGGTFGPEASVATLVFGLLVSAALITLAKRRKRGLRRQRWLLQGTRSDSPPPRSECIQANST